MRNTATHLARQALDCFEWDPAAKRSKLKPTGRLPLDGPGVLACFDAAATALNAIRKASPAFACAARVSLAHEAWTFRRNSWQKWEPRPAALPGP